MPWIVVYSLMHLGFPSLFFHTCNQSHDVAANQWKPRRRKDRMELLRQIWSVGFPFFLSSLYFIIFSLQYLTHQTLSSSVFTTTHFFFSICQKHHFFSTYWSWVTHPLRVFFFFNTSFHWVIVRLHSHESHSHLYEEKITAFCSLQ